MLSHLCDCTKAWNDYCTSDTKESEEAAEGVRQAFLYNLWTHGAKSSSQSFLVQVVCNPFMWSAFLKGLQEPPAIFSEFADVVQVQPANRSSALGAIAPAAAQPTMSLAAVTQSLQDIVAGQLGNQVKVFSHSRPEHRAV